MTNSDWVCSVSSFPHCQPLSQSFIHVDYVEHKTVWAQTEVQQRSLGAINDGKEAWELDFHIFKVAVPTMKISALVQTSESALQGLTGRASATFAHQRHKKTPIMSSTRSVVHIADRKSIFHYRWIEETLAASSSIIVEKHRCSSAFSLLLLILCCNWKPRNGLLSQTGVLLCHWMRSAEPEQVVQRHMFDCGTPF